MKQIKGFTKDGEMFGKVSKWNVEKYAAPGKGLQVTLFSQDNDRIRAHKLVLASVSTPSGTCSRLMTIIHIMNWSIYDKSIGGQWGFYGVRKRLWTFPEDQDFLN